MFSQVKKIFNRQRIKQLTDIRNIALYIFALIVLAVTWSGVRTVQKNYELQKQIAMLNQQNLILELENSNAKLKNQYLQTDQYLELAARQNLGLAAPGEKVLTVPKAVAMKYVDKSLVVNRGSTANSTQVKSKYQKNMQDWRDFLLGRKLFE
jgi:cell division protein FtsB